jgi:hypothetical protein
MALEVFGSNWATASTRRKGTLTSSALNGMAILLYNNSSSANLSIQTTENLTERFRLFGSTGNLLLQNGGTFTDAGFRLDVNGTARVSGNLTAASFIRSGGTSAQILAADGSVITAGTNITISGGTISASGGGGTTIYTGDGTLTGNRVVTMGNNTLTFDKDILIRDLRLGTGATGSNTNTGFGYQIFQSLTSGIRNVAIGHNVLFGNTSGTDNVAIGQEALRSNGAGNENTAVGRVALNANFSGSSNCAFGNQALSLSQTGSNNIGIGNFAGFQIASLAANTLTNQSIYIGSNTKAAANNQTNQIVIGHASVGLGSNTTVIGNSSTTDTAIFGRMLVNFTSPVIGTHALDVNGTARVSGATIIAATTTGASNYSFSVTDNNGSAGANILIKATLGAAGLLIRNAAIGSRFITDTGFDLLGITNNGFFKFGQDENATVYNKYQFLVNSGTTNFQGITILDQNSVSATSLSTFSFYALNAGKFTARIGAFVGSGYASPGLTFAVDNGSGTLNELMRMTHTGNILVNTTTDVASSIFTIQSTTKGFLPPRGTNTQMLAIASPATGLMFYDTTNNKLNCYDGTTWQACW